MWERERGKGGRDGVDKRGSRRLPFLDNALSRREVPLRSFFDIHASHLNEALGDHVRRRIYSLIRSPRPVNTFHLGANVISVDSYGYCGNDNNAMRG